VKVLHHLVITLTALILVTSAHAEKYFISVQPILPADQIEMNYQPLADYLSQATGHQFEIKAYRNFLTYWIKMKKAKDMDFVLDAAHFTDYRIQKKEYRPLVKLPDTVSMTVITGEDEFVFEMEELVSKKIATMASPGMGSVRLNQMFPNPVRQPFYIEASDSVDAVNRVLDQSVVAAIIPSPLVQNYSNVNTVVTTEPVPHMAMSASPDVPQDVSDKVRDALVNAGKTAKGKAMLEALNVERFDATDAQTYAGYATLLEDMFGY
jgi:hypothetical protein